VVAVVEIARELSINSRDRKLKMPQGNNRRPEIVVAVSQGRLQTAMESGGKEKGFMEKGNMRLRLKIVAI